VTDWHCFAPASIARRPVFSVEGRTLGWADIIAAARHDGSWDELEATTRHGLACQKRLAAAGEKLGADVVAEAARRFRHARNLLAGDELTGWLAHWKLRPEDWHGYLVRMVLRERWMGELVDTGSRFSVGADELARAMWVEAVCSGFLARAADRVAGKTALAVAVGDAIGEVASEAAIAREVALHRLEWLRIDGEMLTVEVEDAAREAALCIRGDGRSLADVAMACNVEPIGLSLYVADADNDLSPALLVGQEGELIGPIRRDGAFALLLIETKTPPSTADANVRQRAVERIMERAVRRAIDEHVQWHEHR
jgi:hypothetical protein